MAKLDPNAMMKTAYRRWAPVYDIVFGSSLASARRAAVEACHAYGTTILELGVGTGLSLQYYSGTGLCLTGVDLSLAMLRKARQKAPRARAIEQGHFLVADAHRLPFPSEHFDCTLASFMITLVEHPEHVLDECARVTRPGGAVIIVSHLSGPGMSKLLSSKAVQTVSLPIGLHPGFKLQRLIDWAEASPAIKKLEHRNVGSFGAYKLVVASR